MAINWFFKNSAKVEKFVKAANYLIVYLNIPVDPSNMSVEDLALRC